MDALATFHLRMCCLGVSSPVVHAAELADLRLSIHSMLFFCLPETLYVRGTEEGYPEVAHPIRHRMKPWGIKHPGRKLKFEHFLYPFRMLRYYPIVFQAWFTAVVFTLGSVMPALTGSALFRTFYGWKSARTGLALSLSTTIGGVLGEIIAGPVTVGLHGFPCISSYPL